MIKIRAGWTRLIWILLLLSLKVESRCQVRHRSVSIRLLFFRWLELIAVGALPEMNNEDSEPVVTPETVEQRQKDEILQNRKVTIPDFDPNLVTVQDIGSR
jgi:hypothetical protein